MTDSPDDVADRFAATHAEHGYTIGVYLPPQAPWETVDATLDVIADHVHSLPGEGWDGFVVGLAGDQLGIDTALPDGTHIYMSTSCLHGEHEHCKAMVGTTGEKRPGSCKWCDAVCRCPVCKHDMPGVAATDAPDLTREELQDLVDVQGLDLYRAQGLLAFIGEMCDAADRDGTAVTTERVRGWLGYTGCGGVITLPEGAAAALQERIAEKRQRPVAGSNAPANEPAGPVASSTWTVTTTVTAPTPGDAEHWAGTLRDLQLAEHGQHMRLDITVEPVVPETPHAALLRQQFERGIAIWNDRNTEPAAVAGVATSEEQR